MSDHFLTHSRKRAALAVALAVALTLVTGGCGRGDSSANGVDTPPDPVVPPPVVQITPEDAVASYIDWVSLAYRVANSRMASQTFTPYEEVRVDSYIRYNIEQRRAIDQSPTVVRFGRVTIKENTATVAAHEEWTYRYISLDTKRYSGPPLSASYETTYTVVRGEDGLWRVDKVEANSASEVE